MIKLTGELIYIANYSIRDTSLWSITPQDIKEHYEEVASLLREQLNLCTVCGLQRPPLLDGRCMACVTLPDRVIFDDITEALEVPSEVLIKAAIAELATLGYVALIPEPSQNGWLIFQAPLAFLITCNDVQQLISLVTLAQNTARKEDVSDESN